MRRFVAIADALTERLGRMVSWLVFGMVVATMIVVVLRYGFDLGAVPLQESVTYMHALVFMVGIAYALKHDAHVRVDLVYSRLSARGKLKIDVVGHLFALFPVGLYILIGSFDYVAASWHVRESSAEVGGIPAVFLLKTLIPVMAALLMIQGAAELVRALLRLRSGADG